ncbi:MAG: hypothetical protein QNI95_05845 [Desulfobacterales bacterium]|nr:hypothetical protein [Desulfobacterales bacterium]
MAAKKDDFLTSEVEKRLEDLFSEGGTSTDIIDNDSAKDAKPLKQTATAESAPQSVEDFDSEVSQALEFSTEGDEVDDTPLEKLKAIVLSIDWEISDEIMSRLVKEVRRLKTTYRKDSIILQFLKLLDSLGKYIRVNKGNAHPDATKVLNSVYNGLEQVTLAKGISVSERKKVLGVSVKKFKNLKQEIDQHKEKKQKPQKVKASAIDADIMEELKQLIHDEFKTLKQELQAWLKKG